MKVTLLAPGSRGDVQPFLALAIGLQNAGHQVRFVTHSLFEPFVRSYGIEHHPLAGNPLQDLMKEEGFQWLESGKNPARFAKALVRVAGPLIAQMYRDSWEASRGTDMILFHGLAIQGFFFAQKEKIPSMMVSFQPWAMTGDFPQILFPANMRLGRAFNRLSYKIGEQLFWHPIRTLTNKMLKDEFGISAAPFLGPMRELRIKRHPMLYGFSESVVSRPTDWGDWHHICGNWFLDQTQNWEPPSRLVDFIASGAPPIYIGFGSMTDRNPSQLTRIVLDALIRTKQRGIVHRGWAGLKDTDVPDSSMLVDELPHEWLFPKMSAVVHHGGAGTTAAGLRAGVPAVVVPFFADQPWWGERVHALGAGSSPIPRKELNADRLAEAIRTAATDPIMKTKAMEISRRIQSENGIARAIEIIERLKSQCLWC